MKNNILIKNAILSVQDKSGIKEFAKNLSKLGVKILCTEGTANFLKKSNIDVINISKYIKLPEIFNKRVKTLHYKIYGGILHRGKKDKNIIKKYKIIPIDMVIINFYSLDNVELYENITENIDIGGPSMIRAAAKNYQYVTAVTNNLQYEKIIKEMKNNENCITLNTRLKLAKIAFENTLNYEALVNKIFNKKIEKSKNKNKIIFPKVINLNLIKKQEMRYGENQHQKSALYESKNLEYMFSIKNKNIGKKLSYNNIEDVNTAIECINQFKKPTCIIVKHSNPCGAAIDSTIFKAYIKAQKADPISSFGGIVAFNKKLDYLTAIEIIKKQFVEIIITPEIEEKTLNIIHAKKNIRVITYKKNNTFKNLIDIKSVHGGFLLQEHNTNTIDIKKIKIVTKREPSDTEINDSIFAWKIAKFVKSNAIVFAKNYVTLGIGSGQTSRIYATKMAKIKSEHINNNLKNSVMASDAFFTFTDNIKVAEQIGVKCIIQPGGSIKDEEIIQEANKHNISMIFTNIRNFRH
ncbi:bifunctional phosphoribosylaminoimidazolecarboxamide formyltransferase/IMP cyclohydrolase [Buchnera aphidicola (Neophyllaphis podocarpi)]|uniref:bifunctional phosphoribosylaminoimidazolecarboxamide formyltransferase/IMP cyclohydrolase n=1 Tax=Buchnera aphidicola TaxID=9 RepID=UPI0031B8A387